MNHLVEALQEARARTLGLLSPLPDDAWVLQHSPLMSPPVWDLAHVANYEEQWLLRALGGPALVGAEVDRLYDAFAQPRRDRAGLPLLQPSDARAYAERVRARVLEHLQRGGTSSDPRLLRDGFVYGMVAQHEHQHAETLLATLKLMESHLYLPQELPLPRGRHLPRSEVEIPGGRHLIGTDDFPWAYDNERGEHAVELPGFLLDTAPVTNSQYLEFIRAGGYADERLWKPEGWSFIRENRIEAPLFLKSDGAGGFVRRRFGRVEPLIPDAPVEHVCWYEADAFARWSGRRLPTELEWEVAASWDPSGSPRRHPWGDAPVDGTRANLWQGFLQPAPVGSFPAGDSALGITGLLGDVWEWTASDFSPWPGFEAFPYPEYSEVFFGAGYKVLRGGAWATHPLAMRNTFRNWDFPIRRQIFAGFRTARDLRPQATR